MDKIWSVVYTDNLRGFRRRCMIKKLEILMKQIEDVIEFAHEDVMYEELSEESVEHAEYVKERIGELESQYSMIWRIRIQIQNGTRTSKEDLKYINKVNKELTF